MAKRPSKIIPCTNCGKSGKTNSAPSNNSNTSNNVLRPADGGKHSTFTFPSSKK